MIILVNFGGPRNLKEIESFLTALLTDRDVIRTKFPGWAHRFLFTRIAKRRALRIQKEYEQLGGRSPIYEDTEKLAQLLEKRSGRRVITFHRYLPATHAASLAQIAALTEPALVLPLFPQFSYATTGSIARFFANFLPSSALRHLRWLKSYAAHPAFISAYVQRLRSFLEEQNIDEKNSLILCSAHGIPRNFVETGDPYESECQLSAHQFFAHFPHADTHLAYQSKFGPGEWLSPSTELACRTIPLKKHAIIVPISFTSDHIETLIEIEQQYLPILAQRGVLAYRCPALNLESYWVDALAKLIEETNFCTTEMLVRKNNVKQLYI